MKTIIFLRGKPGSGKTYLSLLIQSELGITFLEPEQITVDESLRQKYYRANKDNSEDHLKYRCLLSKAVDLLKTSECLIWAQPWRKIGSIKTTVDNIEILLDQKIVAKVIELETNGIRRWVRKRSIFPSIFQYHKYCKKFETYNLQYPILRLRLKHNCPLPTEVLTFIK